MMLLALMGFLFMLAGFTTVIWLLIDLKNSLPLRRK